MKTKLNPAFVRVRRELQLDYVFWGGLVMYLEPVEDPKCDLLWVDGKRVGFNPEALAKKLEEPAGLSEATGLLAQGIMKCCLGHHVRRGERDNETWQDASDYVTNPIILDSGLRLPHDSKQDSRFKNKRVESVYDTLYEQRNPQPPQGGGGDGKEKDQQQGRGTDPQQNAQGQQGAQGKPQPGQGKPQSGKPQAGQGGGQERCEVRDLTGEDGDMPSPADVSANEADWQINMQQALNNAQARGEMPGGLQEMVEKLLEPVHDWKNELHRFAKSIAKDDYSWMRGNRHFLARRMYLPSVHSQRLKTVVVVVDTSGSIGHKTLQAWGAEVNAVLEEAKPERVILIDADARVAQVREYTSDDLPLTFDEGFRGRGGTDFRPAFKWIDENDVQPDAVLYLTDLYGTFPEQEPEYPVLWGACNTGKAPWGETIHVEVT